MFPGLNPSIIPIFPSDVKFNIHYRNNPKTQVWRCQYPLCTAYTFTDHKAQGQTLEPVVVDIGPIKKFMVDPFAAYMALSRSRSQHSIRLLWDFNDNIFTRHLSESLWIEDEQLAEMGSMTNILYQASHYNYLKAVCMCALLTIVLSCNSWSTCVESMLWLSIFTTSLKMSTEGSKGGLASRTRKTTVQKVLEHRPILLASQARSSSTDSPNWKKSTQQGIRRLTTHLDIHI